MEVYRWCARIGGKENIRKIYCKRAKNKLNSSSLVNGYKNVPIFNGYNYNFNNKYSFNSTRNGIRQMEQ